MSGVVKAHIAIVGANLIYGLNYMIAKGIMPDYIMPYGLTVCRGIGAIFLFWMVSFFGFKEKIDRKDFLSIILSGVFGIAMNQMLFLKGLSYTSAIDSSIIMTINPIAVLCFAAIFLKERITILKITGIITGASGAIFLILYSSSAGFDSEHFFGNILMLGNALSYGVYLIIVQPMMKKYHPVTVMKWAFLVGFIIILPFGYSEFTMINWQNIPLPILLSVLYVVIASTFIAYLLNVYGLKHVNTSDVSIYIYSQPVIAAIVAALLGNENMSLIKIIAMLLVFSGVYMVSRPDSLSIGNKFKKLTRFSNKNFLKKIINLVLFKIK